MTNPIIIDAVENAFVPLLIINNTGGEDAKILKKYNEPAWNYQVIRFLSPQGKDIIPRKAQVNTKQELVARMVQTLETAKQPVPKPLLLMQLEQDHSKLKRVALSCHCYWTGEYKLGSLDGVVTTESGWLDGHEVTMVVYHSDKISLSEIITHGRAHGVANGIYLENDVQRKEVAHLLKKSGTLNGYRKAKDSDQKRQLSGTPFARLDLSAPQATKVNAFCRSDSQKALSYLTKAQRMKVIAQ